MVSSLSGIQAIQVARLVPKPHEYAIIQQPTVIPAKAGIQEGWGQANTSQNQVDAVLVRIGLRFPLHANRLDDVAEYSCLVTVPAKRRP